jgi:pyruvate/2-oxoglutarate dehydrogenase complex dihydrolipoamide acyltransferase (E2) component
MTDFSSTTNPNAARGDDDDDHTIVVPPPAPGDLAVVLPDGRRLWLSLPPLAPLLSPVPALLDGPAYDEAAAQSILRDALDVTERPHQAPPSPPPAGPRTPAEAARRPRKPTITSVARAARKAGIDPARIEIKADGTVVVSGKDEPQPSNEVDEWIAKHARAPERH